MVIAILYNAVVCHMSVFTF